MIFVAIQNSTNAIFAAFFFFLSNLRISKALSSSENHMICEHVPFLSSRNHLEQTDLSALSRLCLLPYIAISSI